MRFFALPILFGFFLTTTCFAQNFNKILSRGEISKDHLGIYIVKNKTPIFENRSDQKMVPASLSKLLTAIAVLKNFSPEQRMTTELNSSGKIKNNELEGSLCIKGNGNPSFISEQLWVLVDNFTRNNIKKIKGPILVDSTYYDSNYFDNSREKERVDRAYDSPVSGLPFNWNAVNVYVRPNANKAEIFVDPESNYFEIVNRVKVVSGHTEKNDITVSKEKGSQKNTEKIIISGIIGKKNDEIVKYASITNPDAWVGQNLISFLKQRGIEIEDEKISSQSCPDQALVLASTKGWTVYEILDGMLKFSNNFLAESMTKNLSVKDGHSPGTISYGVEAIKNTLEKNYGLKKNSYDFVSPSGFTNKNKISAKAMGNLLAQAYNDFSVSSYLLSAMATPQTEGTLSKRMKNLDKPLLIRAKTGLLNGVVGLAGYAADTKGEVYSFVFIYNGSGKEDVARTLFDKLAVEITKL